MERRIVRAVCPHDCPDTCSMAITVQNGKAIELRGDSGHVFTNGFLCGKVAHYLERVYHPQRLLQPLKRVGPKGESAFVPISWDEALETIAGKFQEIAASAE